MLKTLIERFTSLESNDTDGAEDHDRVHAQNVAPSSIKLESDITRTGERWAKTLFFADFPAAATPGLLDMLTTHPSADIDISIHASPRESEQAIKQFERAITDLDATRREKEQRGGASLGATQRRLQDHKEVLAQLTDGSQRVFEVAVYLTIRGNTKKEVQETTNRLQSELMKKRLVTKSVDYTQDDGLVSNSPIAKDTLEQTTPMLGKAAGALFPFSASTLIEESGVLVGYHATTDAPVVMDRFDRENGYNILTAAKIGSGKSFGTKLLNLRQLAKDPDTILIMIDPLEGFRSLSDALDGEHIVVGGTRGLNPLEIKQTPTHVLRDAPDIDPFSQRFSSVMGFFDTFFAHVGNGLDKKERAVLGTTVREAYRRNGITADPSTHGNASPTIRDVIGILAEIADDAAGFLDSVDTEAADPTELEVEKWQERAADLRMAMRPFMGNGEFSNLAGETEVNISDEKVVYLDLQQGEADREIALMMQLLFDNVYQRAKETDKRVILAVDEAHYLMEHEGSLQWLDRATRHSRHYDLSIHLVTQELKDFFIHPRAETIANNCSMKILYRLPGLSEENCAKLGLTSREAEFIRNAKPGDRDRGYSHALVSVEDEGTYPVKVTALEEEAQLIESSETKKSSDWG
ncbi:hypothetical protein SAMN04487948_12046 [Halogranum amylolyticum]|uniref:TraG P-loop domain-containing protein n=1 Tax=Halogranum amylolyticum TaxID=660520 RepID=A0A1H8VW95_9EURY|nr:transfer complex protein [Halogranum amylolyticum]SEP19702.1 hypothetical protein SAMN04487948_12046 [Halogranum amylolyticum]